VDAERVEQGDDVADDVEGGVGRDVGRRGGAAVAAEVRRHAAVAPRGQVRHLVAPRVPELREAVQEHHRGRAVAVGAGLRHVHRDAVRLHRPVPDHRRRRHARAGWLSTAS
jgi:ribosomal protein S13